MSFDLADYMPGGAAYRRQEPWTSMPELTPATAYLNRIKEQAVRGSFDGETLDRLISEMVGSLSLVHRGRDLEAALESASRMLAFLEEVAKADSHTFPSPTIADVIDFRKRTGRGWQEPDGYTAERQPYWHGVDNPKNANRELRRASATPVVWGSPVATLGQTPEQVINTAATSEVRRIGPWGPIENFATREDAQDVALQSVDTASAERASALAPVAVLTPSPDNAVGVLNGKSLRKSIFPTWVKLVLLSWVAVIWGGIISLPVGIGAAAVGGIIAVPFWATIFGFFGMGRARKSTLKAMGFEPLGPEVFLVQSCRRFAQALDIEQPEVGTIDVFNAFAMGTNENDGTIAMGRPLLERLSPEEAEAVLAHEMAHVVSGDMKRMMLMRTFQNATVWFMIAQGLKQFMRWVICWAAELYILAFSRKREYWADAIAAALTSKEAMIGALRKLEAVPHLTDLENTHARFMVRGNFGSMFSTHPSCEERIAALETETYMRNLPRVRTA